MKYYSLRIDAVLCENLLAEVCKKWAPYCEVMEVCFIDEFVQIGQYYAAAGYDFSEIFGYSVYRYVDTIGLYHGWSEYQICLKNKLHVEASEESPELFIGDTQYSRKWDDSESDTSETYIECNLNSSASETYVRYESDSDASENHFGSDYNSDAD